MKPKSLISFAAITLLTAGCITNGTPPPPPQARAAVLFTNGSFWNVPRANMRIVALDSERLNTRQVSLAPGHHSIQVRFRTHDLDGEAFVSCDLKADRVYEIWAERIARKQIKVALDEIYEGKRVELQTQMVTGTVGP
jgi:hypothetical protein